MNILGKLNLVTPNGIKQLFGSSQNYMGEFLYLHNCLSEINDVIEVNEFSITPEEIIKQYELRINCPIAELEKNNLLFGNLLLDLRKKCNLSLRDMEKIFGISKDKLNKYIHKVIDSQ